MTYFLPSCQGENDKFFINFCQFANRRHTFTLFVIVQGESGNTPSGLTLFRWRRYNYIRPGKSE